MLKYFRGASLKIYLHEYLTHEYFHTRKFPDLQYKHNIYRVAIFTLEKIFKLKNFQTIDGFTETTFAVLTCGYIVAK